MQPSAKPPGSRDAAAVLLGYLNFSSGAFDAAAWRAMNELFATAEPMAADGSVAESPTATDQVAEALRSRLSELAATEPAFRDTTQARWAIDATFGGILPAYRRFHADLLEHQPPGAVERPFFVMAAIRGLLAEATPDDDQQGAVTRVIDRLNDYVGWRPLAVLENGRLSAPYPHERVRPIPLYVAGAGAAHGRYRQLVAGAISILGEVPVELLRQADFDLDALEELAIDPRAFDFLHPAASRPNYLFGLWDPSRIDDRGMYRRMVVQQATLDGILSWPDTARPAAPAGIDEAEFRWESSAVLAGVMLMASGLSGHGPGALQASLPLAELLPRIASYRDEFYRRLLGSLPDRHRQRLEEESRRVRQPFGGVRRHINAMLAGRRARQVENVALAAVMARLGRAAAAERLAGAVPAASARMLARVTSRVVAAQQALWRRAAADEAVERLDEAADLLMRAVGCGAMVDPWNILGLSGQFPLHEPGGESLPDPRVDDLVNATGSIIEGYAAAWRQASLAGATQAAERAASRLERLAAWWDTFATTTVSGVPHLSGRECVDSARDVIAALGRRHETAPAPPPPGFWKQEVAAFSSPRSHAQAADALLDEGDLDGAAGLLVHWASLLEGPAIERSGQAWLAAATRWVGQATTDRSPAARGRVRRFLELVEANTSTVVDVIIATAVAPIMGERPEADGDDEDDQADGEERVAAAYETMVWRDSADDGVEGGMIDVDGPGGGSLDALATVEDAAELLRGVLRLYREAVIAWCTGDAADGTAADPEELDAVAGWSQTLRRLRRTLVRAATLVALRDQEPPPGMSPTEFDRLRWQRDAAAERLVDAAVQAGETLWILSARLHLGTPGTEFAAPGSIGGMIAAFLRGDPADATVRTDAVCERLVGRPVLYVPLARGGRADRIVKARTRERLLERMASSLPRLGLVQQAITVVQLAKALESRRPPGGASVSEFDRVFEAGTTALVERIVESSGEGDPDDATRTARILDGLALLVPKLLETWMTHARQLRLSVLERVRDDKAFATTREFVERYGQGLFTQHLLAPSSLRGILRGGVRNWLEQLVDRDIDSGDPAPPAARHPRRLIEDLASGALPMKQAAARLRLVLESIAENHAEYRDWNSTTTQSDRGECLHILLDYLRVKAEHDRIAWTLRPVGMAHRVLARRGAGDAAEAWRARLRDETRDTAAGLVRRLDQLEGHWSVRLASISDRVRRPFTTMLEQDELEALVVPAVAELVTGTPAGAGAAFEAKADTFLGVASGSGVEVPEWLERLSSAVDRAIERADASPRGTAGPPAAGLPESVPWVRLPWDALKAALAG
ncbi:MAG: hypothetical protein KJS77_02055 [Planctomycetes bacterium]|nr:hypothetical protein [Planctomycetota bacterium]